MEQIKKFIWKGGDLVGNAKAKGSGCGIGKDFNFIFYLNNFLWRKVFEVSRAIFLPSLVKEKEVLGPPKINFLKKISLIRLILI